MNAPERKKTKTPRKISAPERNQRRKNALLIALKALATFIMAWDTYHVAIAEGAIVFMSVLYVLFLDVLFAVFWYVAAHGRNTDTENRTKVLSAAAAWIMFAGLLSVAVVQGRIPLLVRGSIALYLAYDTVGTLIAWWQRNQLQRNRKERNRPTLESHVQSLMDKEQRRAYEKAIRENSSEMVVLNKKVIRARLEGMFNADMDRAARAGLPSGGADGKRITQNADGTYTLECVTCAVVVGDAYPVRNSASSAWSGHTRNQSHNTIIEV